MNKLPKYMKTWLTNPSQPCFFIFYHNIDQHFTLKMPCVQSIFPMQSLEVKRPSHIIIQSNAFNCSKYTCFVRAFVSSHCGTISPSYNKVKSVKSTAIKGAFSKPSK